MSRQVRLYIATSIDGFIARKNGDVDWLFADDDYGYTEFYDSIDTTLMGRKTYEKILTFGEFPYKEKTNFVFTSTPGKTNDRWVTFEAGDAAAFVRDLKKGPGGSIWLVGGGELNGTLLTAGLIDELILSVHPIILSDGIRLFGGIPEVTHFTTARTQAFASGLVQMRFRPAD